MRIGFSSAAIGIAAAILCVAAVVAYNQSGLKQQSVEIADPAKLVVVRTPGGMLEVATLRKVEEFGWQAKYECPLVDCSRFFKPTISKLRVPVHYVYRIPLAQTWELRLSGSHYDLIVPELQPQGPVAFDTTKLEVETKRGWFSPTEASNERALMRQLGPELQKRAGQEIYLRTVQPYAEQTVREFAVKWLQEQRQQASKPIRVQFRYSP